MAGNLVFLERQNMFPATLNSLSFLEGRLKCNICAKFANNPVTLGGCEHIFCSGCCQQYLGGCCPVCDIPAHVKDAEVDRLLFTMATLCRRLRQVVEGSTSEDDRHQHVKDSAAPASNDQEYSKAPKLSSEVRISIKHPVPSADEVKIRRKKKAVPGRGRAQKAEGQAEESDVTKRQRPSIPDDQKTMTQFFDHADEDVGIELNDNEFNGGGKECFKKDKTQKGSTPKTNQRKASTRVRHSDRSTSRGRNSVSESMKENITAESKQEDVKSKTKKRRKGAIPDDTFTKNSRRDIENVQAQLTPSPSSENESAGKRGEGKNIPLRSESSTRTPKAVKEKRSKVNNVTPTSGSRVRLRDIDQCDTPTQGQKRAPVSRSRQAAPSSPVVTPVLNKRNARGETPLQVAAIKNDVPKVRDLLTAGANPNVRDNAGWTPLHEACNHGYVEVASLLLDHGAMINVPGLDNDTPLHDAVSNNRPECVKLLVSRGASLTARNMQGLTPVDLATSNLIKKALETPLMSEVADIQTEAVDVMEYQAPCLLGTGLTREEKIVLQKAASQLQVKLVDEVTPEVTHLVTRCNQSGLCPRTVKILQAILMGRWILNMEWLETCMQLGSLVCEEAFEVQGLSLFPDARAPHDGRMNRKQQLPGLFDGCHFYFHGSFEYATPSKDDLIAVVKSGGGKFLSREPKPGHLDGLPLTVPYHADSDGPLAHCCIFIVHEASVIFQPIRTKHMCSVPATWIMDSAANFRLLALPDNLET